jgi:hypothetical protein
MLATGFSWGGMEERSWEGVASLAYQEGNCGKFHRCATPMESEPDFTTKVGR